MIVLMREDELIPSEGKLYLNYDWSFLFDRLANISRLAGKVIESPHNEDIMCDDKCMDGLASIFLAISDTLNTMNQKLYDIPILSKRGEE